MTIKMIKDSSVSFRQIKNDITEYLMKLENWQEIKDNLPGSNLTIITDLLAGFGSYMVYKNHMLKEETYLSKAKLDKSIYDISRTFGYSIKRYTAPGLIVKYIGVPTLVLDSGDVIGTYLKYDLVYFGNPITLEKNDTIEVKIGMVSTIDAPVKYEDNLLKFLIAPEFLKSVADSGIRLYVDDKLIPITIDTEEYVVHKKAIDVSLDPYKTELYLSDSKFTYGIEIDPTSDIHIQYLETDGQLTSVFNESGLKLNPEFRFQTPSHEGSNGQSLEQIRTLAPLFYSTQRRMVTEQDHKYIVESHQYIKSASAERDEGIPKVVDFEFTSEDFNRTYNFKIEDKEYKFTPQGTSLSEVLEELISILNYSKYIKIVGIVDNKLRIQNSTHKLLPKFELLDQNTSDNLSINIINPGVASRCCTVNIYYVKYNTVSEPISLTQSEQVALSNYLEKYKMVGVRIILKPADVIYKDLKLILRLKSNDYKELVLSEINKIIQDYELQLNHEFKYGELVAQISQIKLHDNLGDVFYPVVSVLPNQEVFDIEPFYNKYIKFKTTDIQFIS